MKSPKLLFLEALARLLKVGAIKTKDQAEKFFKNEFGELDDIARAQINKIFKKKGDVPKAKTGEKADVVELKKQRPIAKDEFDKVLDETFPEMKPKQKIQEDNLKTFLKSDEEREFLGFPNRTVEGVFRASIREILAKKGIKNFGNKDPIQVGRQLFGDDLLFALENVQDDLVDVASKGDYKLLDNFLQEKKLLDLKPKGNINLDKADEVEKLLDLDPNRTKNADGGRIGLKKGSYLMEAFRDLSKSGPMKTLENPYFLSAEIMAPQGLDYLQSLLRTLGLKEGGRINYAGGSKLSFREFVKNAFLDSGQRPKELEELDLKRITLFADAYEKFIGGEDRTQEADGGRIGLKKGMDRRTFMKIVGGISALPIVGKFLKFGKPVAKTVAEDVSKVADQAPDYFFNLVSKIKMFGKEGTSIGPRQKTTNYKNYELTEDVGTGDLRITKQKGDKEFGYEEEVMEFRKGQRTEDGVTFDEYDEATIRPDMDGKMKDIEDGIEPDSIKQIIKDSEKQAPPIKKASGGLAYMLGE